MLNRYTGRRAVNRALRDWLTWVQVSWLRRLLPGPLSGKHYQVRVDARVLLAFPGNGHYRRAGNTWSHGSRAGTSSEKLVFDPNPGLRPWVRCRQRVFDIAISTKAEVLEALHCGLQFLTPRSTR